MTPLQDLIGSLCALVPGHIPHLFVAWLGAVIAAAIRLGIDEYRDEHRTVLCEAPFLLATGFMLTALVMLHAARDSGLIAKDFFAGWLIGSLVITIPFIRRKWRHAG